jgi:hypothetical protein
MSFSVYQISFRKIKMEAHEIAILCLFGSLVALNKITEVSENENFCFRIRKKRLRSRDDHLVEDRSESGCQINFQV